MAVWEIGYNDKDKAGSNPENQWRDVDANEVKDVVNLKADLVDGLVPVAELPDEAVTVTNANDVNATGRTDGSVLTWDEDNGEHRYFQPTGGLSTIVWDANGNIFDTDVTDDDGDITLGLYLQDQDEGEVLIGPVSGNGQPAFRRLELSDLPPEVGDLLIPQEITGSTTITESGIYVYTGTGGHTFTINNNLAYVGIFNASSNGSDLTISATVFGSALGTIYTGEAIKNLRWASFLSAYIY